MDGLSGLGMGLFSKMVDSWKREQFCDITIKCSNLRKIKAPSILLGTISTKLSDILNQCCDSILNTRHISIHLWKALLTMVYMGNAECLLDGKDTTPTVRDIRQFAECLDIQSVVDICENEMGKGDAEASHSQGYNYVTTNPMEFNLVFYVDTDEGKERMTSRCQSQYNDPGFELLHKLEEITTVSQSDTDDASESEEIKIRNTSKKLESVSIKKEQDVSYSSSYHMLVPVDDSSMRRSSRTRGKRKTYTPYGIKEDGDETETKAASEAGSDVDLDESENFVPEQQNLSEMDEEIVIKEEISSTSNTPRLYVRLNPNSKKLKKKLTSTPEVKAPAVAVHVPIEPKRNSKKSGKRTTDAYLSKKVKVCFQCHSNCTADFVQCRLCFQVVDGSSLKHVEDEHPLLNNVIWPVTCDIEDLQPDEEAVMIGRSTVGYLDGESALGTVFQCMECIDMFVEQSDFDRHLREHTEKVFTCRRENCHFAFKTEVFRTEHQHFCTGGNLLKCFSCQTIIGGMIGYNKHKCSKADETKAESVTPMRKTSNRPKKYNKKLKPPAKPKRKYKKRARAIYKPRPQLVLDTDIQGKIGTDLLYLRPDENAKEVGHLTQCCRTCGFKCGSETTVQCLYCGVLVKKEQQELHVLSEHPNTPEGRIWPVDCSFNTAAISTYVVCKFQTGAVSRVSGLVDSVKKKQTQGATDADFVAKNKNESGLGATEMTENFFIQTDQQNSDRIANLDVILETEDESGSGKTDNDSGSGETQMAEREHTETDQQKTDRIGFANLDVILETEDESGSGQKNNKGRSADTQMADKENIQINQQKSDSIGVTNLDVILETEDESGSGDTQTEQQKSNSHAVADSDVNIEIKICEAGTVQNTANKPQQPESIVLMGLGKQRTETWTKLPPGQGSCCLCDFVCNSRTDLKAHMNDKHQRSLLFCITCHHGFDSVENHSVHMHFCSGNEMLMCARCDSHIVGSVFDAKKHEVDTHPELDTTKLYVELKRDTDVPHINGRIQRCFYCGENGCDEEKVKCILCTEVVKNDMSHMDEQHPLTPSSSVWPVSCKYNKTMKQASSLVGNRVVLPSGSDQKPVTFINCLLCRFNVSNAELLSMHMRMKHNMKYVRPCDYCGMALNKYEMWRDHDHFCGGGDLLSCALCNLMCGGLKALNDHVGRNHPEVKGVPVLGDKNKGHRSATGKPCISVKRMLRDGWQPADIPERSMVCCMCGDDSCMQEKVKCIYCQVVVDNDIKHMNQHPFVPAKSLWVFTCDVSDVPDDQFVLCEKGFTGKRFSQINRCELCPNFNTNGDKEMLHHFKIAHSTYDKTYKCKHCNAIMSNYSHSKDHEHYCGGGCLLRCEICDVLCGSFKNLMDHVAELHVDDSSKISTEDGSIVDSGSILAVLHSNTVLKDYFNESTASENEETIDDYVGDRKQDCYICEGTCRALSRGTTKDVKCMLCNDVVENSPDHMTEKHPYTAPDVPWPVACGGYKRAFNAVLVQKSDTVHPSDGLHRLECKMCSYQNKADAETEFVHHFREIHKSTIYFCELCNQGFQKPTMKKDHERLCGGHGFPSCSFCGRRCACYEAMVEHIKANHIRKKIKKKKRKRGEENEDEEQQKAPNKRTKHITQLKVANFDASKEEPDINGIVKLCAFCGTSCISHDVRCMLCFKSVHAKTEHMLTDHAFAPTKTWIVTCKNTNTYRGGKITKHGQYSSFDMASFIIGKAGSMASVMDDNGEAAARTDGQERVPMDIQCTLSHDKNFQPITNMEAFEKHINEHHKAMGLRNITMCQHCNFIFSLHNNITRCNFSDHEYFCAGHGLYHCEVCDLYFQSTRRINEHMTLEHKEFAPRKAPKIKLDEPIIVPPGRFIRCSDCGDESPNFDDYTNHVRSVHQYKKTQVQVCAYCFKVFKVLSKRQLHEQKEHFGGRRLACHICEREFNTPTSLRTHIIYYHEGGRIKQKLYRSNRTKLPCSYCGKLFLLGIHLKQHERVAHQNEKPYQCRICGLRFTNHSACTTHEDRHTGRKRFVCPYCDYRAYKGSRVNEHVKTKHPGRKRPYGWDVVEYDESDVVEKGDEFIVQGNFTYKPKLKREKFDFGDYEKSYDPDLTMAQPYRTSTKRSRDLYIASMPNGDNVVDIKMMSKDGEDVQMYYLKDANGVEGDVPMYLTEDELRSVLVNSKQKMDYGLAANTDEPVQYVFNASTSGDNVKQDIQYVVDAGNSRSSVMNPGVQYVLGTDAENKDIQYIIDTDDVNEEAKQEVELIINSAVAESSVAGTKDRTLFKTFLGSQAGAAAATGSATDQNLVYYIVNK